MIAKAQEIKLINHKGENCGIILFLNLEIIKYLNFYIYKLIYNGYLSAGNKLRAPSKYS